MHEVVDNSFLRFYRNSLEGGYKRSRCIKIRGN